MGRAKSPEGPTLFAEKLLRRMDELGWSQKDLADAVGVAHSMIWSWLRQRILPSITSAMKLVKVLGLSLDYLLDDSVPVQAGPVPAGPAFVGDLPGQYRNASPETGETVAEKTLEKLLAIAEERGLNYTELAHGIGVSPTRISIWKAERRRPGLVYVIRASRLLGVPLDYLLRDELDTPEQAAGLPSDEQSVLDLYHALGITKGEALRRLALNVDDAGTKRRGRS